MDWAGVLFPEEQDGRHHSHMEAKEHEDKLDKLVDAELGGEIASTRGLEYDGLNQAEKLG